MRLEKNSNCDQMHWINIKLWSD